MAEPTSHRTQNRRPVLLAFAGPTPPRQTGPTTGPESASDGTPLPERAAPDTPETTSYPGSGSGMGSRLVAGLCAQIGARLESHSLPGMRHEIHLPPQG